MNRTFAFSSRQWIALALLTVFASWIPSACGQNNKQKGNDAQVRQATQEMQNANDAAKQARGQLEAAEKGFRRAEAARNTAAAKVQKARKVATQEQTLKLDLQSAVQGVDSARRTVTDLRTSLLAELQGRADFQAAGKAAEKASADLKVLRNQPAQAGADRQALESQFTKTIRAPVEMERQYVDGAPALQSAQQRLTELERSLISLREQIQKSAEADPQVQAAIKDWRQSETELNQLRAAVTRAQSEVSSAQAAADRERQQFQQALAQDRKDDTPKKKKKK